jgi:hypothetical protein
MYGYNCHASGLMRNPKPRGRVTRPVCEKLAQILAQSIVLQNEYICKLLVKNRKSKILATSAVYLKLPIVKNHPIPRRKFTQSGTLPRGHSTSADT